MRKQILTITLPICIVIVGVGAFLTRAGDLNPPTGMIGPTMHTLTEVFDLADAIHAVVVGGGVPSGCDTVLPNDPLFAGVSIAPNMDNVYMFLQGIPGEVTDPSHTDWIDVLSVSDLVERPLGGVSLGPFRVLARLDRALPPLLVRAATGANVNPVRVEYVHPTSGEVRVRIEMDQVTVVSVMPLYQAGAYVTEFMPLIVRVSYVPLDGSGQPTGPAVEFCWDVVNSQVCP